MDTNTKTWSKSTVVCDFIQCVACSLHVGYLIKYYRNRQRQARAYR